VRPGDSAPVSLSLFPPNPQPVNTTVKLDILGPRQQVQQNAEEVGDAAAQDEQMPDHVAVGKALPDVEDDTDRIGQSASAEKDERAAGHVEPQFPTGQHDEPTHDQIEDECHLAEAAHKQGCEQDADNCQCPDGNEQSKTPSSPERKEQKRRVGSGDEQVDRRVIEHPE